MRKRNAKEARFHHALAGPTGFVGRFDSLGYTAVRWKVYCEHLIIRFCANVLFHLLPCPSAILHIIFLPIKGHFCSNYCLSITLLSCNKASNLAKWLRNVHPHVGAQTDALTCLCICLFKKVSFVSHLGREFLKSFNGLTSKMGAPSRNVPWDISSSAGVRLKVIKLTIKLRAHFRLLFPPRGSFNASSTKAAAVRFYLH